MDINLNILSLWGKLTNWTVLRDKRNFSISFTFGEEQEKITDYRLQKVNKKIEEIIQVDSSGSLAVIYLKDFFYQEYTNNIKYSLSDLLDNKYEDNINDFKKIHALFSESEHDSLQFIKKLSLLSTTSSDVKLLGEEIDYTKIYSYISSVLEEYKKLNKDIHSGGSLINKELSISSKIKVVKAYAQALLEVENSTDGIYLYYIENSLMDGYFAIIIKSNDSILSVNDRLNEVYPGQHVRSRTGRYSEDKAFNIFPYDEVLVFTDGGYKQSNAKFSVGHKAIHENDETFLYINNLSEESRLKLFMTVWFTLLQYEGKILDNSKTVFVDSLLKQSTQFLLENKQQYSLTIKDDSTLLSSHVNVISIENEDADYFKSFENTVKMGLAKKKTASFDNDVSEKSEYSTYLINRYAQDWQPNKSNIIKQDRLLLTMQDSADSLNTPMEFVATKEDMNKYYFWSMRRQLAEHIKNKIDERVAKYGNEYKLSEMLYDACRNNINNIIKDIGNIVRENADNEKSIESLRGKLLSEKVYIDDANDKSVYGKYRELLNRDEICPITGSHATIFVKYIFRDLKQFDTVINKYKVGIDDLIDLKFMSTGYTGNNILDMTDAVAEIRRPFENTVYSTYSVYVKMSKRGLNTLLKNSY